MNHYINLLEESECRYFSAAESSPLLKIGAAAGVVLAGAVVFLMINAMTSTIRDADQLTQRWDRIKDDVAEARERTTALRRIEDGHATLTGWSNSRYPWHDVLNHIQTGLPEPQSRFQFTRLYLEEDIQGLRRHRPGIDNLIHPWTRTVNVELRGLISGLGVESAYHNMERDLVRSQNDAPPMFERARLENSVLQTEVSGQSEPIYLFNFSMALAPREILP